MKYMGSKHRIGKKILPIILKDRKENQIVVEPFCGGCNFTKFVTGPRLASDNNFYLIEMWKSLQEGWMPPTILTEDEYRDIKDNKDKYEPALVAFAGFPCSFGAKWFGGYARGKFNSIPRNYAREGHDNLMNQITSLRDVKFIHSEYDKLDIPENGLVYLDPPYAGTTKYKNKFDHDAFWEWVRELSKKHSVFISEYTAPDDFECLLEINHSTSLDKNKKQPRIEKLFKYKG